MENTKDLVRAERSGRFVCQVWGGGHACGCPAPGTPQLGDPARGPASSSHAPSVSGAPLPLLAVKRSGVPLPPQPLT